MTELPDLSSLARMDERLRETAVDAEAVERALARALSYAGNAYRILGRYAEAIAALQEARRLAPGTAATVRLAEAHRCADQLGEAEQLLREALAEPEPAYDHFVLQHLGKTLLDQGRTDEAISCLERALDLRRAQGDAELARSTEQALARARRQP